jgi:hypothetical protein
MTFLGGHTAVGIMNNPIKPLMMADLIVWNAEECNQYFVTSIYL